MYQKANPQAEISARNRDQFWAQQEVGTVVLQCLLLCFMSGFHPVLAPMQQDEERRKAAEKRTAAEARREQEVQRREQEVWS